MRQSDEPALGEFDAGLARDDESPSVPDRIRALVQGQLFAVLCTQGQGQPYGSVVAYVTSPDLNAFAFATPVFTRKFRLLRECDRVALVVDNRDKSPGNLMRTEAITATGHAVRLQAGAEFDQWADWLTTRHPYLKSFVAAPSTALFRVDVVRYLYVTRFQEVNQWIPRPNG